jgi:hypothetical protein
VPNREHAPTEPAPATASKPESKMPTHGPAPAKHSSKSATAPTHGTGHDEHR